MKRVRAFLGLSVAIALIGAACTDSSHSPTAPLQAGRSSNASLLGINLVPPVHRTTPLASDVTWSFTAGPAGAVSTNSDVGLTVIIPWGALSTTETITVTALKGSAVAYGFAPHLVFAKNVTLKQNLAGTDVSLLGSLLNPLLLNGAHFAGETLQLDPNGLALVDETVPAAILSSLLSNSAVFKVGHFTGWILAGNPDDGSGGY